jgi:RsiW-degrading membrane proteinase PrsW (M82 family)
MLHLTRFSILSFLWHALYAAMPLVANVILIDRDPQWHPHKMLSIEQLMASGSHLLDVIAAYLSIHYPSLFALISQGHIWLIVLLWCACVVLTISDVRVGIVLFLRAKKHKAPALVFVVICMLIGVLLLEASRLFTGSYGRSLLPNAGIPNLVALLLLPLAWRRGAR